MVLIVTDRFVAWSIDAGDQTGLQQQDFVCWESLCFSLNIFWETDFLTTIKILFSICESVHTSAVYQKHLHCIKQ